MTRLADSTTRTEVEPLHDLILVKEVEKDEFVGAIYIPPASVDSSMPRIGTVLKTGPDVPEEVIQPGDHVTYGHYQAQSIKIDNITHYLVQYVHLIAKVSQQTG